MKTRSPRLFRTQPFTAFAQNGCYLGLQFYLKRTPSQMIFIEFDEMF